MSKKIKIPAFWQHHWPSGEPASCWTMGQREPVADVLKNGWFAIFHPEQELEINDVNIAVTEKYAGQILKAKEVDLSQYIHLGAKLKLKQRITGKL